MDRGLDEIIAEKRSNGPRNRRGGGDRRGERGGDRRDDRGDDRRGDRGGDRGDHRRRERQEYPRDGIRKSQRSDSRNIDSEWVHDRFEENNSRRGPAPRRRRDSPGQESRGSKIRVDNIHYDLTEEDLDELFKRIGPVTRLQLLYDRAGRSEGTAYVTYDRKDDADEAIREFDGANANGQPIRLTLLASRNPFDSAVMPSRPLAERVSAPGGRSRSYSPPRRNDEDDAARRGIDRYVPGNGSRSRSPAPPRRGGGRRPGARREGGGRDQEGGRGGRGGRANAGNPRSKKTQEELDAEMADYFGGNGPPAATTELANGNSAVPQGDDVDMIE